MIHMKNIKVLLDCEPDEYQLRMSFDPEICAFLYWQGMQILLMWGFHVIRELEEY